MCKLFLAQPLLAAMPPHLRTEGSSARLRNLHVPRHGNDADARMTKSRRTMSIIYSPVRIARRRVPGNTSFDQLLLAD